MIGSVLGNRYEIINRLASGGMANVYLAKCRILKRQVTIKVLKEEFSSDKEFLQRFQREAQAVASLSHPNIVNIYDVGEEKGLPYIVMEYIEGENLKEVIRKKAPFSPREIVNIGSQVCAALEHAHGRGVIHRDIKPHNILVTSSGRIKVTDFGLARMLSAPAANVTQSGTIVGSVYYFSPEQAQGQEVDARSDLYSLGVVLYEMATGDIPFRGDTPISVALKHIQELPPPVRQKNPAIPPEIADIINKAMSKDPEKRFSSAAEMKKELLNADLSSWRSDEEQTQLLYKEAAMKKRSKKRQRPNLWGWLAIGIALIVLISVFSWAASRWLFAGDVVVPAVEGLTVEEAKDEITKAGLHYQVNDIFSAEVPGEVVRQSPLGKTKVKKNRVIKLWVSKGSEMIWLPDVRNYPLREAQILLEDSGFKLQMPVTKVYDENIPEGKVVSQDPEGDQKQPEGTRINLTVSKGSSPQQVVMPQLVGRTIEKASDELVSLGLVLGEIKEEESQDYPAGLVCAQEIASGTVIHSGDTVIITKSKGPGPQVSILPLKLQVRENGDVKIVVHDRLGERVFYQQFHKADENLEKDVEVYGSGEVYVYFQGQLVERYSV